MEHLTPDGGRRHEEAAGVEGRAHGPSLPHRPHVSLQSSQRARSVARRDGRPALVVAPAGDEAVAAVAATATTVVTPVVATVVAAATVVRAGAAALALARTARAGRPTTVLLRTGDEALEVVLGDRRHRWASSHRWPR